MLRRKVTRAHGGARWRTGESSLLLDVARPAGPWEGGCQLARVAGSPARFPLGPGAGDGLLLVHVEPRRPQRGGPLPQPVCKEELGHDVKFVMQPAGELLLDCMEAGQLLAACRQQRVCEEEGGAPLLLRVVGRERLAVPMRHGLGGEADQRRREEGEGSGARRLRCMRRGGGVAVCRPPSDRLRRVVDGVLPTRADGVLPTRAARQHEGTISPTLAEEVGTCRGRLR